MRIPLSRIYRAFPELDRFTDEQCQRFVRAACRRGWGRFLHWTAVAALVFILYLITLPLSGAAMAAADDSVRFRSGVALVLLQLLLLLLAMTVPLVAGLFLRDALLRRRIRYVVRARGTCPGCRYSLLGIPLSEERKVVCPECGLEGEVDPSLGELTVDAEGRERFTPSMRVQANPFWTERRRRIAKRVGIALAGALFIGLPALWGGYELFLARQAAAAQRDRPGLAGLTEFVESHQPGAAGEGGDAWEAFEAAVALQAQLASSVPAPETIGGRPVVADFALIYDQSRGRPSELSEWLEACRRQAMLELEAYEQGGLYQALAVVARRERAASPGFALAPSQPLVFLPTPLLNDVRHMARLNGARMHLARERGETAEYLDALESTLALARMTASHPSLIGGLTALGVESLAHDQIDACLAERPGAEWVDGVALALARQRIRLPRNYHIEGERLLTLDGIAWFFAAPRNARLGAFSPMLNRMSGGGPGRLGTYAANRRTADAIYDAASAMALLEPSERSGTRVWNGPTDLLLLDILLPAMDRAIETFDQAEARRRGTQVLLALERFRLDRGDYPRALAELAPDVLPSLPLDPWSGEPLRYTPVEGGGGRGFLLYSVGPDGADDGGVGRATRGRGFNPGPAPAHDVIIGKRAAPQAGVGE